MKKYKVKLNADHKARPEQMKDGYLALAGFIQTYTRGEAIKKAGVFGGKIELVQLSTVLSPLSMTTIPENALLDSVVVRLKGREAFKDTSDMNEQIYHGDVFKEIAVELLGNDSVPKKVIEQLYELAELIQSDYVMVTQK